jgi:ribA/ribD-fused uncharacterized protein
MPITSFREQYRFLSNFYVEPDGTHVEGEFQAQKVLNPSLCKLTPFAAKQMGCRFPRRTDWDAIRLATMELLVRQKFTDHHELQEALLATGDEELVEGNYWNDTFWGVCNGHGLNHLGKILMKIRNELQRYQTVMK